MAEGEIVHDEIPALVTTRTVSKLLKGYIPSHTTVYIVKVNNHFHTGQCMEKNQFCIPLEGRLGHIKCQLSPLKYLRPG